MPAPTVAATGTTTTDGTEQSLGISTGGGTYVFQFDTSNLQNGDTVEIRIYTKTLSGSTKKVLYNPTYTNAQGEPNKQSPPVLVSHYFEVTIKRTAGTDRAYDWEILEL